MEKNMTLDQKEKDLLKDLKGQEKLCVDKYAKHASCAKDAQLKNLFTQISQNEQKHLDALTQIENGTVPQFSGTDLQQPTFTATSGATENPYKKNDCYLPASMTPVFLNSKMKTCVRFSTAFRNRNRNTENSCTTICQPTACTHNQTVSVHFYSLIPQNAGGKFPPAFLSVHQPGSPLYHRPIL